jgi:CubicO group peptidase (beta-lactamase class C family)
VHLDDALGTAVVAGTSRAGTRSLAARGVPPEACFRIASLTKTFTSTALVLAMRDRGIPLSTPVAGLLPGLAAGPALTVERLLGQVSGLRESVDGAAVADLSLTEAARLVVRAGSGAGARWSYYNGNYFVAGAVLAALGGAPYETVLAKTLLEPWRLSRTGFGTPSHPVTGWDGPAALPLGDYPMARRPSGGLWSCVPDLLALGEGLLGDRALLEEIRRARTAPGDPMTYGLGWVLGPSGQMYVNGRLPGYRAAMLLIPDRDYVSVVLTNQQNALPAAARLLSELQKPLTGQDVAAEVDGFAA